MRLVYTSMHIHHLFLKPPNTSPVPYKSLQKYKLLSSAPRKAKRKYSKFKWVNLLKKNLGAYGKMNSGMHKIIQTYYRISREDSIHFDP